MEGKPSEAIKSGRSFDSAYSFSFSIAIGLVLFIGGLLISLTLGQGTSIGLIFGIPLLVAGLILPLIMMRDLFRTSMVKGPCPFCAAEVRTSDATISLACPSCNRQLVVKEMKFHPAE
jgi:DNA-directed RNA polymerase subunit RPC12/RpoP